MWFLPREALAQRYGAQRVDLDLLAGLLIRSESIIAVARGAAEFGPRALGHRSFLAATHSVELKERLNRLKHRKWYRPCAPIVAREDLDLLFEPGPDLAHGIPYMSFAPPLQDWVKKWLPGIAHLDGTARPQSVDREDDEWMHALLSRVREEMAEKFDLADTPIPHKVGVLINTSLNPKGMPIATDPMDILQLFCAPGGHELDFVLLEEIWLFERSSAMLVGLCDQGAVMPASSQLSPFQKLQRSERLKMSGTAFMQSQDFRRACRTYQLAQDFLGYVKDWEQEERHHAEMLRKACKSNEVMAWIKLEQFREALDLCTEILEGGGGMEAEPSDHKALYRRGLSYLALGEAEGAKEDFRKLLALDPMNKEAKAQLVKCRELEKAQAKKSEELLKGMIGAAGDFGYPMGCSTVEGQREREREAMLDRLEELKAQGPWVRMEDPANTTRNEKLNPILATVVAPGSLVLSYFFSVMEATWLQCKDVSEVLSTLAQGASASSPEYVALALHALARWQRYRKVNIAKDPEWQRLCHTAATLPHQSSAFFLRTTWAIASVSEPKSSLQSLLVSANQKLAEHSATDLCRLAWCTVELSDVGKAFLEIFTTELHRRNDGSGLGPLEVSQLVWSMARLQYYCEDLLVKLQESFEVQLHECDVRHLANTLWSFAKLSYGDAPCISRLASASVAAFAATAAPVATELSQCLWALAVSNSHTLATEHLLEMAKTASAPQHHAAVLWSAAKLTNDRPLFAELAGLCKESLGQVSLTHLGAIAWSCAAFGGQGGRINKRSGYRDAELLQTLERIMVQRQKELTTRLLTNVFWSFATLLWPSGPQLFSAALGGVAEMKTQELAMLSWSWATLEQQSYLQDLLTEAGKHEMNLTCLKTQELACFAWSLASLAAQMLEHHPYWQHWRHQDAFEKLVDEVKNQDLSPDLASALLSGTVHFQDTSNERTLWAAVTSASTASARAWRETELLRFVECYAATAPACQGQAQKVLMAVEEFCKSRKLWLKLAGGVKAQLLETLLQHLRPSRILEVGCYVGYSAVRFGAAVQLRKGEVCSVEMDPIFAQVARKLVHHAQLTDVVSIHVGHSEEVLPRLSGHFDMIFFDQRGSRFLKDVEILLHEAALTTHGTVLVADNVLKPGAPRFLWYLQGENEDEDGEWETCLVELPDFGSSGVLDWMSVSKRRGAISGQPVQRPGRRNGQPPEDILHLAWQADEMRWRSIEGHVSPMEWNNFAGQMKASLLAAGLRLPHRQLQDLPSWLATPTGHVKR
eukprot:symbB.v1.2.014617.t2/scaffold1072.1/size139929/4